MSAEGFGAGGPRRGSEKGPGDAPGDARESSDMVPGN